MMIYILRTYVPRNPPFTDMMRLAVDADDNVVSFPTYRAAQDYLRDVLRRDHYTIMLHDEVEVWFDLVDVDDPEDEQRDDVIKLLALDNDPQSSPCYL